MSTQQPTFTQRIRLLDICAHEVEVQANKVNDQRLQKRLRDVANLIADEASRMKLLNQRWQQERKAKTAAKATALTS
jgi:hypothetical protein